ncbi:MAG: Xaa-Pro peptidase family protein [Candidatus Neomarinimicrobiota bacterium]
MNAVNYARRLEKLRKMLAELDLDGMLVSNLTNVRYLSGFTGSAGSLLVLPDKQYFFSDGRYLTQSKEQVQGFERVIDSDPHLKSVRKRDLVPDGLNLAFEGDVVSVNTFGEMDELFPQVDWEPTTRIVEEIAAVKDAAELELIRQAVAITDRTFEEILPLLKPGTTEKAVANVIRNKYFEYGDGEGFDTIIAGGPNSALPHARPTDRPFQIGDFVVVDTGALFAGYTADMTRTVLIGEATAKHLEFYEIVKNAQQAACDAIKAGVSCKLPDDAARNYIAGRGYGDLYIHGTGHGIGLEIHTMPRLSQVSQDTLLENYVVTVEPGIYEAGWNGVRIEDDVVVKKNGCEILNRTTRDLLILK